MGETMGTSSTPGLYDYSTTASQNSSNGDLNLAEGMAAGAVNDSLRQMAADIRADFEDKQWTEFGHTPVYVSGTSFTIATDVTSIYHVGRRLKLYGASMSPTTQYATITSSSYSAPNSTITVTTDSGSLGATLSRVWYGAISATNRSYPLTPLPNIIINGDFDIWQRATSQTTTGWGSADRWYCGHTGSTKTASRQAFTLGQTDVPGEPTYFMRHVVTSVAGASNHVSLAQSIESVRTLAGQTATLSFYAKADSSKNMAVEFFQSFGTGGTPSTSVTELGVTTCALTTSWQKFTVTVAFPSISGKTLGTDGDDKLVLYFWFDAGSSFNTRTNSLGQQSGTFDIAHVKLEKGPVATDFIKRLPGEELALCQRYYEVGNGNDMWSGHVTNGYPYHYTSRFATTKRRIPSMTLSDVGSVGFPAVAATLGDSSTDAVRVYKWASSTIPDAYYRVGWTADAEL